MLKITLSTILFCVFSLTIAQTVTTVTEGEFHDGLGLDSQGNIYCSDFYGDSVYKYDTNGVVTVFKSGFSNPNGIGVNGQDQIFICDHTGNTIYKYDNDGNEISTYGSSLVTTPTGIKNIPNTDEMLIVEYSTNSIKKLNADETIVTLFTGTPLNGPVGIAFINGETFIGNYIDRKIFKLVDNTPIELAQLPASGANLNNLGFLTSFNGKLYATQLGEHKIYSIDPNDGTMTIFAGSVLGNMNGDLTLATFNFPNGILGDETNNRIYVSDLGTKNLRILENVLSVDQFSTNKLEVILFQNPTKEVLNINYNNLKTDMLSINIMDTEGKVIFSENYDNSSDQLKTELKTANWSKGTYILSVSTKTEKIYKKFVL